MRVQIVPRAKFRVGAVSILLALLCSSSLCAQSDTANVNSLEKKYFTILNEDIVPPSVAEFELRQYIVNHVAPEPKTPSSAKAWDAESTRLRQHILDDVVFHGWPTEWVKSDPRFQDAGVIETGKGYRIRKLRYEIVPGFESSALLYEPEHMNGSIPAILNPEGHVGPVGQAAEFKQKRCINFARNGILALSQEWFDYGELNKEGNQHSYGAHLNLVGGDFLSESSPWTRLPLQLPGSRPQPHRSHRLVGWRLADYP